MRCDKCSSRAVIFIRYSGQHLCANHFKEFVLRRVKNELRCELGRTRGEEHIVVAVSGGKDSLVTLHLLNEIYREHRAIRLTALSINEGIEGYRPLALRKVEKYCEEHDIPYRIVGFEECGGVPMDRVVNFKEEKTPCAICGVFRRNCLNTGAKDLGATRLATGLNLDDTAQTILMNLTRGDIQRLIRLGPHRIIKPGLIPRIQPLRQIPEKESYLFALLEGIDFYAGECPYAKEAQRNIYRHIIEELEAKTPGTRHAILKTYDTLYEPLRALYPDVKVNRCERCGEPTSGRLCKTCQTIEMLKERMAEHGRRNGRQLRHRIGCREKKSIEYETL